ncbi:RNA polymerase subunit sigma-70 [Bacillus carboniphilus]|uniref:RNA polymerase subunit sigma-70 n=1 Tax=Bacillus carboniphilus TaxID=86663 RepID=A0ABN0VRV0_9BACI
MNENSFSVKANVQEQEVHKMNELYRKLQQYCLFLTQNKWDGEDLAQEVFSKVWCRFTNLDDIKPSLLNKIAYNQWIDITRKKKREVLNSDGMDELLGPDSSNQVPELVEFLLNQLTPKQAVVLLLKEAFQYQSKEVAEILKTTEESVKATLFRIRKRLQKDGSPTVVPYWSDSDQEELYNLFVTALVSDDPSILIKDIPFIRSLTSESTSPKRMIKPLYSTSKYSPSCTLSMAA